MEAKDTKPETKKRSPIFLIVLVALIIGGGWFGFSKYKHAQEHEDTDDAQVSADISPVIPRVAGYITEVRVEDNSFVKKGDTLLIIDDRDYQLRLQESEAALETAKSNLGSARASTSASQANISTSQASVETINAQIEAAKVTLWRADQDFQRYANLIKDHSVTQQQYEQALAAKQSAERQVQVLQQQRNQAAQQTRAASSQSSATSQQIQIANAAIKQREVDVNAAKLNLTYTVILAPNDGLVSRINIQAGQFLQAGQSLFSIVHSDKIWVIANFKETQLRKMTIGQKVVVKADAIGSHKFDASLASFSPATGSTFALLPPDNATGNFVKVVQRLPVRIEFTNLSDSMLKRLRPGMNVDVDVSVKE